MGYTPRLDTQLGRGIRVPGRTRGSRDCGPRTWRMGIDAVTKGDLRPGIKELRKRGSVSGPQQTSIFDAKKAVESYKRPPGRKALKYTIVRKVADVKTAAAKQRGVHICVHYGEWNKRTSGYTGDPNFQGGHSMLVKGQRYYRGTKQWLVLDPLEDGRRSNIRQGPTWRNASAVIAAMERFAGGQGRCYAGVFGGGGKR